MGGPSTTILYQRVACVQYISNSYKLSAGGLKRPTILSKTTLTGLIILNLRKDPLAQAIVPYNNLLNYLYIKRYFINTNLIQSLVLQQEIIVAALAKMAFIVWWCRLDVAYYLSISLYLQSLWFPSFFPLSYILRPYQLQEIHSFLSFLLTNYN